MSYIHKKWGSKYLSSPKPRFSDELNRLVDMIDDAQEKYDKLRCSDNRTWMPASLTPEAREARKILAALSKKYQDLFENENPEYIKHWRS